MSTKYRNTANSHSMRFSTTTIRRQKHQLDNIYGTPIAHFMISKYVVVPIAAVALVAITASGSFRRWERAMFVFIAITLLQIPMLLLSHPEWGRAAHDFVVPGVRGGLTSDAVLLIIAIVGTTVAPWQLFFQQSNIVDKRITPRFIGYERADTTLGAFVVVIGAAALMMTADHAARATGTAGQFTDAGEIAHLLGDINRALALIGLPLPSASVFLLLLCNDPQVLGTWVNRTCPVATNP